MSLSLVKKQHKSLSNTMATTTTKTAFVNPMKTVSVAQVTLNMGAGKNEELLKKGLVLLEKISTPIKPVKTITTKRIAGWGLRPGLAIGCKVTIRKNAELLLKRLLTAKGNIICAKNFDRQGNFSFGIPEYIDIPGLAYDPDLKILGLDVAVTLKRPGFRITQRKVRPTTMGKKQHISKEAAMDFVHSLGVEITEREAAP